MHWLYQHPIVLALLVLAWFGAVIWLTRDKEIDRQDKGFRTNQGRNLPPRSPSRKKRGL
jgi:hypothetical protein